MSSELTERKCNICGTVKEIKDFTNMHAHCKKCYNNKRREARKNQKIVISTETKSASDLELDADIQLEIRREKAQDDLINTRLEKLKLDEQRQIDIYMNNIEYVYILTSPGFQPPRYKIGKHRGGIDKLIHRYNTFTRFGNYSYLSDSLSNIS